MADVLAYVPVDITTPQLSVTEVQKFGPWFTYIWNSDQIWVGTGDFGDQIDYGYEGYGFRQGTSAGYLTGITAWLDDELLLGIDDFTIPFSSLINFTPGLPISQLGIFKSSDYMLGSDGNDVLKSAGGSDVIDGFAGDDKLYGGYGGDEIAGGLGRDLITGGFGSDYMEGEAGNDTIRGGAGGDTLLGGSGSDVLVGGGGGNYIYAGSDNNVDTITVLTDGNYLGRRDHAKYDDLYELGSNDRIIMDVNGSASLEFTSFDPGEIDIWVDGELEAVVHGLSLNQVKAITSLG